jgi:pSer/pThr/pTyr-binding forkhead associated (FHA) protein
MIMSGVEDGLLLSFALENGDGTREGDDWLLRLGRSDDNDICLRSDTFSSRRHAQLRLRAGQWWLEDCSSKNGTFIEGQVDDVRIEQPVPLQFNQLFRVGRTWLRLQSAE